MSTWIAVGWLLIILGMAPLLAGLYLEHEAGFNDGYLMTVLLVLGGLGVMASGIGLLIGIWFYT